MYLNVNNLKQTVQTPIKTKKRQQGIQINSYIGHETYRKRQSQECKHGIDQWSACCFIG